MYNQIITICNRSVIMSNKDDYNTKNKNQAAVRIVKRGMQDAYELENKKTVLINLQDDILHACFTMMFYFNIKFQHMYSFINIKINN